MPDADCLRLRAIRYLAMSLKAREDGDADFAACLAERATELSEEAATLANCSKTPKPEASPEPSGSLHPASPPPPPHCARGESSVARRQRGSSIRPASRGPMLACRH